MIKLTKTHAIQSGIFAILIGLIGFYVYTEIPFEFDGYDRQISRFQRFDAELDESIVQVRFGLVKHYDIINNSMIHLHEIIDEFKVKLENNPHSTIREKLYTLEDTFNEKEVLTERFKRLNPALRNSIQYFSVLMAQIIESEAHLELIESCFEQEYQYQLVDKVRSLFRGVLIYTNKPDEQQRQDLLALIEEIRNQPERLDNLDLALIYADVILKLQPELNETNQNILTLPIVESLANLNESFKEAYAHYNQRLEYSRFFLYFISIILIFAVSLAFKRLQAMISQLSIEIDLKNKAEKELAEINRELEQRVQDRTKELAEKNDHLNEALDELKEAQDQLIMQEKMASVGMLTTGIAHEIKNPLNFVNNFSDISVELVNDLIEEIEKQKENLTEDTSEYLGEILEDLKTNSTRINEHGKRADDIVENMLLHSQEANTSKEMTNLHTLLDDSIKLALESMKSANDTFNAYIEKIYQAKIEKVLVAPPMLSRVFVNLVNNALYAVDERKQKNEPNYKPHIKVSTFEDNDMYVIKVWDNGVGIAKENINKIFEPFYTTKPTGRGNTGLGLSISYDTVVKQHKGELSVKSEEGDFTEFTVKLPIKKDNSQTE